MNSYRPTRGMGLAVLAGGLAFVGNAEATELIVDGGFESTSPSSNPVVKVGGTANPGVGGGWSFFSTYLYSTLYAFPGPSGAGQQFLRPYPSGTYGITQSSDRVIQEVSLTEGTTLTPAKIDAGDGQFTMSAWFSSYRLDGDYSDLTLEFLGESGEAVGSPVALGGMEFIAGIPTGSNSRYQDAKQWSQDQESGLIPAGARTARVTVASTLLSGAGADGYVDLVSLDVADAAVGTPTVVGADPPNNAVGVGPVVNLNLTLQDGTTAVDVDSIELRLDDQLVEANVVKQGADTLIEYAAGLLPALSAHTYELIFSDDGTPPSAQTNAFQFTVADYLTLPAVLASPLGSEDATRPGFNVSVFQVATVLDEATQVNLPPSIAFSEAVLEGLVGSNIAYLAGAEEGNTYVEPDVINWTLLAGGAVGNFPNDLPFPGIPGDTLSEDSFVHEIETYLRFPSAGYYEMGINNEDQFRLTAATEGQQVLELTGPTNVFIPCVPIATNITQLQFGGALPLTPLTAPVMYATPSGNPDDACLLDGTLDLTGMIALLDRGGTNCDSAFKAEQAQRAGAVAVIQTTPGDTGYPFRLGEINPNVHIPVLVVSEVWGGGLLKSYLTNGTPVTATIRGDAAPRVAEWDGPKGFGAVDVTFGFAVPSAGVYPLRLVTGQESGTANLEWFSIDPDGTRILINDSAAPTSLRAFRTRTFVPPPMMNPPTVNGSTITISWTGSGVLEETTSLDEEWDTSPIQTNPQSVTIESPAKYFRVRQ
jgi:hypothetical protein